MVEADPCLVNTLLGFAARLRKRKKEKNMHAIQTACIRQEQDDEVGWSKRGCCLNWKQTVLKGEYKGGLVKLYLLFSTSAPFTIRRRPDRTERRRIWKGSKERQGKCKAGDGFTLVP